MDWEGAIDTNLLSAYEIKNRSLLLLSLLLILFNRFLQNITCRFHGHLAAVFRLKGLGLNVLAQGGAVFGVEFAHQLHDNGADVFTFVSLGFHVLHG